MRPLGLGLGLGLSTEWGSGALWSAVWVMMRRWAHPETSHASRSIPWRRCPSTRSQTSCRSPVWEEGVGVSGSGVSGTVPTITIPVRRAVLAPFCFGSSGSVQKSPRSMLPTSEGNEGEPGLVSVARDRDGAAVLRPDSWRSAGIASGGAACRHRPSVPASPAHRAGLSVDVWVAGRSTPSSCPEAGWSWRRPGANLNCLRNQSARDALCPPGSGLVLTPTGSGRC